MVYLCNVASKQTTRFLEECPLYRSDQSAIANCRLNGGIMIWVSLLIQDQHILE